MSISKIRENARVALAGKWGKGACMVLAYLAFAFVAGLIIGLAGGDETLIGSLLNLILTICEVPLIFGLSYAFIKLKRNEEVKAFDFLNLGFSNFGRAWKISLREALKLILPLIGVIVGAVMLSIGAISVVMAETSSTGLVLAGLVVYIASLIWLVVRSLLYSLTTYVAYDNPNMDSKEVVNESARMMKGNRGKLFLLSLSFIGWAILAVFTLGIGYLWLMPYMMVAQVCFYEHLLGNKEQNSEESNVDAIIEM